jgi:hypothetical protein
MLNMIVAAISSPGATRCLRAAPDRSPSPEDLAPSGCHVCVISDGKTSLHEAATTSVGKPDAGKFARPV